MILEHEGLTRERGSPVLNMELLLLFYFRPEKYRIICRLQVID